MARSKVKTHGTVYKTEKKQEPTIYTGNYIQSLVITDNRKEAEKHMYMYTHICMGFPGGAVVRKLPAKAGDGRDMSSIPGWGRSPGGGNGNPPQYSCLENSMDRGPGGLQSMRSQSVGHD